MVVPTLDMSTGLPGKAYQWLKSSQYWLLPGTCVACRQPSGRDFDLCPACEAVLPCLECACRACALPLPPGATTIYCGRCLSRRRHIEVTCSAFAYAAPVSSLISQFKYQGRLQHGRVLASLCLRALARHYREQALPRLLLPVPLHPARLRERGFNQALLLAEQFAAALDLQVAPTALLRVRQTPAQQGLSARERKRNLRGAFALADPAVLAAHTSIALVDDVITTASTMRELARLLHRHAGRNLEVHAWCLARA